MLIGNFLRDIPLMLCAATFILSGCAQNPIEKVLKSAMSEGRCMYGHQDDLMYGHCWSAVKDGDQALERSDVKGVCGHYPMVLGLDLGGIETGAQCNLDGNDFSLMREAARKHVARGGIVTLSWHLRNPLTGGDSWDVSSNKAVESVLPGGCRHQEFNGWLDLLCDYLQSLDIPVIFRPWHEHTGSWFWWGAGLCTPEQYNQLWTMTYDHVVKERGVKNVLWAISPGGYPNFENWMERYPGDEYVDIIGLDQYQQGGPEEEYEANKEAFVTCLRSCLAELQEQCERHGKIMALTETGVESIPGDDWWTGVLAPALKGFPVAYVLTWRNSDERPLHYFGTWPGERSADDFRKWIESDNIMML